MYEFFFASSAVRDCGRIPDQEIWEINIAMDSLSGNLQHPTVDRDNLFQKFGFPAP